MILPTLNLDPRLQARHEQLVKEHLSPAQITAAGLRALPGEGTAFASTQAAWRFFANPRTTLPSLGQPLLSCGEQMLESECRRWGLVVHDWSELRYTTHTSKRDQIPVGSGSGYCLEAALLLSDQTGAALSPLTLHLWAQGGCYTTRAEAPLPDLSRLDAVTATMEHLAAQEWSRELCHIIDRASDSAAHLREWDANGQYFLIRGDEGHKLQWNGATLRLGQIADQVELRASYAIEWEAGVTAQLFIGETQVTLTRPSRKLDAEGRERYEKGAPLSLRLIVSEVRLPDETVATRWCLLSNLPAEVTAETLAMWYYWRWRVESYFKLLKSHGWHLEQWQQESAEAICKRLCVVALACVVVWQLQRAQTPEAESARALLLRLSGRQVRRGHATEPALLAGLWSLLSVLDALEHYSLDELKQIAQSIKFATATG